MNNMRDTVQDPASVAFKAQARNRKASNSPARSESSRKSDVGGEFGLDGVILEVDANEEVTANKEDIPYDKYLQPADGSKESSKEPFSFGAAESVKGLLRDKKPEPVAGLGQYQELNEDYATERETAKMNYEPRPTIQKTEEEKIQEQKLAAEKYMLKME